MRHCLTNTWYSVSDVWVAGKRLLRKRALVTLNEVDIKAVCRAVRWSGRAYCWLS